MLIGHEDRLLIAKATILLAQQAVSERAEHPKLDKILGSIEKAITKDAVRRGEAETEAKARVKAATTSKLAGEAGSGDESIDILNSVAKRAKDRLAELNQEDEPTPVSAPNGRTHMLPHLGVWTLTHSLLRVKCDEETPGGPFGLGGADEMLYAGTFTYAGPGGLFPYYHSFNKGDIHSAGHVLMSVPIMPGTHAYSAVHLVAEQDFSDEDNSKIIAVSFTLLLDLLLELGIQIGKAAMLAFLKSLCPQGDDKKTERALCERMAEETVEAIGKVASDKSDDLLGILAEWLAEALGPEVFPNITSEATIEWHPPTPPQVLNVKVNGSGTVFGRPRSFLAPNTSVVLGVPLKRSGGGKYTHDFSFTVTGQITGGIG